MTMTDTPTDLTLHRPLLAGSRESQGKSNEPSKEGGLRELCQCYFSAKCLIRSEAPRTETVIDDPAYELGGRPISRGYGTVEIRTSRQSLASHK